MTVILPLYILLFIFLFHFPALLGAKKHVSALSIERRFELVLIGLAAIAILTFLYRSDPKWSILLVCNFAIATIVFTKANGLGKSFLPVGGFFAIGFTFIAVQNPELNDLTADALILFTVLFIAALNMRSTGKNEAYSLTVFIIIAVCLFLWAMHYDKLKTDVTALFISSHHWSVYLSPIYALKDGAVPFRDFSLQYGIGPTALLASLCKTDCWRTMSVLVPALNIATFAFFSLSIMRLTRECGRDIRYLALFALLSASIFWIGNPEAYYGPFGTPSVNGMRFIFLSISMFCALSLDFKSRNHLVAIIPIWIIGSLWSMESFFFVSAIFTCAIIFDRVLPGLPKITALKNTYIISALVLFAVFVSFMLARYSYELLYGEPLNLRNVFLNFIYLPGPLPVDLFGLIFLIGILLLLAIFSILKLDRQSGRNLYITTLGLAAALSYYLSRSHDNNIVNIYPLIILLITALYTKLLSIQIKAAMSFWFAGVVAGPSLFFVGAADRLVVDLNSHAIYLFLPILFGLLAIGWQSAIASMRWLTPQVGKAGLAILFFGLSLSGAALILDTRHFGLFTEAQDFSIARRKEIYSSIPEFPKKSENLANYDDILALYNEIKTRADGNSSPILINSDYYLAFQDIGGTWTPINNFSNAIHIPDSITSEFVIAGARHMRKSGWMIIEKSMEERWLAVFLSGYQIESKIVRGNLTAYHLVPQ